MKKRSIWPNTAALVLIPAAVGINYIGKLIASTLKLPLWLDSIGTILSACMAGPVVGAICGAINNIIYGFTLDPMSFIYAITSVAIGIVAGIFAYKGLLKGIVSAVLIGLVIALTSTVVSTPINIAFWGGQTGNLWGDALFALLKANHFPVWIASALDELVVDIPDKLAVILVAFGIYKALPKKLLVLYKGDEQVEKLD